MGAGLIDDFIHNILSIPFCPYHFVRIPFCPYHFVRYHFVLEPPIYITENSVSQFLNLDTMTISVLVILN